MSLENWVLNGWLVRDNATVPELTNLFAVVDRELNDAEAVGLSVDGKFMHAYDAALTLSSIALRASGFRVPKGAGHHKRTIESLSLTMGAQMQAASDEIEIASRKRGQALYDRSGVVEARDANDLLDSARSLRSEVASWLARTYPKLLPRGIEP